MHAHIHARIYNIINREEAGCTYDEGGPYFTEKFDKSARVLRFLQPYPSRTYPPQPRRELMYTLTACTPVYIYL